MIVISLLDPEFTKDLSLVMESFTLQQEVLKCARNKLVRAEEAVTSRVGVVPVPGKIIGGVSSREKSSLNYGLVYLKRVGGAGGPEYKRNINNATANMLLDMGDDKLQSAIQKQVFYY